MCEKKTSIIEAMYIDLLNFVFLRDCPSLASQSFSRGGFKISRVGSGRVKRFQNLAVRVGSGQEVFKSRGSDWVMTREMWVTRGSSHHDPRVVFG